MADEEVKKEEEINYKDKYLYLLADFENYKKRIQKDIQLLRRDTFLVTIKPFLQVNDYLEMAKIAIEKSDNIESLKQGLNIICEKFSSTLTDMNISKIKTIGEKFDPSKHNAIEYKKSDDIEEGYIIHEVNAGYLYKDYVLIPSNVIVSSGK